jgi:hypothetical protein
MIRNGLPGHLYFAVLGWLIGLIGGCLLFFAVLRLLARSLDQLQAGITGWPAAPWHDLSSAALGLLTAGIGHLLLQYKKPA